MNFEEMVQRYEKLAVEHEELAQEWSRPTGDRELDTLNWQFAEQERSAAKRCKQLADYGRRHLKSQ